MKLSEIKQIKAFCESLLSEPCWKEAIENIVGGENDFEVNNVRFINGGDIDQIQQEELSNDLYTLGCFNANFLASILGSDQDVIEARREVDAF